MPIILAIALLIVAVLLLRAGITMVHYAETSEIIVGAFALSMSAVFVFTALMILFAPLLSDK
jgi:hypothetical protein